MKTLSDWLRQTTDRFATTTTVATGGAGATHVSVGHRTTNTEGGFVAEGEYYRLEPPLKPGKIHVKKEYSVDSIEPGV